MGMVEPITIAAPSQNDGAYGQNPLPQNPASTGKTENLPAKVRVGRSNRLARFDFFR